ncbi:MAG TPA: hypothetical protein VG457_06140, partial [Planctomycetota bacterium]|nr:hypothetical protein [Planctomycetota bacterium]
MLLPQAAFLLGTLFQVPPDDRLEWRVERFVAGDESERDAIRKAGPSAMRLLRSSRPNPRVSPLLREIRFAAASIDDQRVATRLSKVQPKAGADPGTFLEALGILLGEEVPWSLELLEFSAIATRPVAWPKAVSGLDVLEDLCEQVKVDFAFHRGGVRIAAADRLWPPPPPRTRFLTEEEARQAEALVSLLGAESPAQRDRATAELRKYGPTLLPLLEAHAAGTDLELSSRCKSLAAELRQTGPPPPKKVCIATRSTHASTRIGDPDFAITTLMGPSMTFFRLASPSGPMQEITVAADRGVMESQLKGSGLKVTLTGRVLALGQDGTGVRADEVVIDVTEETFVCKGHLGV